MTIDEEKLSKIYQQGKETGPSAQLDKTILEAAHAAVQQDKSDALQQSEVTAERKKSAGPFSGGWPAMASIAALLLITIILVPLIEQETPPVKLDYSDEAANRFEEKHAEKDSATDRDEVPAVLKAKQQLLPKQQPAVMTRSSSAEPGALPPEALKETTTLQRKKLSGYQSVQGETSRSKQATVERLSTPVLPPAPSAVIQSEQGVVANGMSEREPELNPDIDYQQGISSRHADMAMESIAETEVILQPDNWLQKIRELIAKRDFVEARDELEQFKQRYPDEEIDPEISRSIKEFFQNE